MLDPALCVAWKILKLLFKLHNYLWRKCFFYGDIFLLLKVYKFYQTMIVLNAFAAISEGLKLKMFRGSMPPDSPRWPTSTHSKLSPSPRHPIVNLPCNSVSDNQSFPPPPLETCPSGSHLVRLLFASQLPIKKTCLRA